MTQIDTSNAAQRYLAIAAEIVQQVAQTQLDTIEKAAQICANTIINDGLVFLWGGGHSRMSVEEMFPRIGSFPGFFPTTSSWTGPPPFKRCPPNSLAGL